MLLIPRKHDLWAALTALAAGAMPWQSTVLMAGLLTVWTAMDLIAECHARRTLVTLARAAPGGAILVGQDASSDRVVRLVWGPDPDRRRWHSRA